MGWYETNQNIVSTNQLPGEQLMTVQHFPKHQLNNHLHFNKLQIETLDEID